MALFHLRFLTTNKSVQMKFFKKLLLINALGVSVAIFINSSCKADGG